MTVGYGLPLEGGFSGVPPVLLRLKRQESSALSLLESQYELLEYLAAGAYGRVSLAREIGTGELRAVKSVVKREQSSSSREPEIVRRLNHPNIQKFVAFFEDPDECHIVTEFCPGCDLQQLATPLSIPAAEDLVASLAHALRYLHANDVAHCDLKAENVVVHFSDDSFPSSSSSGGRGGVEVKLIDFGAAVRLSAFPNIASALVQEDWRALARLRHRLLAAAAEDTASDVYTASNL